MFKEHIMYNLLDEQWVSVLYRTGKAQRISLLAALKDSDKLQLAYSNPMDRFAVFRFLLALGYWCYANTSKCPEQGKPLPAEWMDWLNDTREYFELFETGKRFYQPARSTRIRPVTDLIHELPSATNIAHFNHVLDYVHGLCEACCVSGLLRLPVFTTVGGSGIGSGINKNPPFYAVWAGTDLADMLIQNWEPRQDMGTPAWLGSFEPPDKQEVELLNGLTWLPRHVYLHDPVLGKAACCACGTASTALVYSCEILPVKVPSGLKWQDPHAVTTSQGKSNASRIDVMSGGNYTFADRDWYRPLARYFEAGRAKKAGVLWVVGFASDQAKRIDVWEKAITLAGETANRDVLTELSDRAYSLNAMRKRPLRGGIKNRKSVGVPLIADVIPHVEGEIASQAGKMADSAGFSWEDAGNGYRALMAKVAESLKPDITFGARESRNVIMYRKPYRKGDKVKQDGEDKNE